MATRKTKSDAKPKTETLGQLSIRIGTALDQEPGQVQKKLRARIRNNFETYAEQWPGLDEAKENRDGNRYPAMPATLADAEFDRMTAKAQS